MSSRQSRAAQRQASFSRRSFLRGAGACIALASFFLVKYSIEEGLLGPGMQVVLVLLLGIALLA